MDKGQIEHNSEAQFQRELTAWFSTEDERVAILRLYSLILEITHSIPIARPDQKRQRSGVKISVDKIHALEHLFATINNGSALTKIFSLIQARHPEAQLVIKEINKRIKEPGKPASDEGSYLANLEKLYSRESEWREILVDFSGRIVRLAHVYHNKRKKLIDREGLKDLNADLKTRSQKAVMGLRELGIKPETVVEIIDNLELEHSEFETEFEIIRRILPRK